jgi:hypothetical protein
MEHFWLTRQLKTIQESYSHTGKNSEFISIIEGLKPGTIYYVRAYASNSSGTAYGDEQSFKTYLQGVNDIDGNIYYTVRIGSPGMDGQQS